MRVVLCPTPQHHLALAEYQRLFPGAFFVCGRASGQMPSLAKKRRDLRFDGILRASGRVCDGVAAGDTTTGNAGKNLAPILDPSPIPVSPLHPPGVGHEQLKALWDTLTSTDTSIFDVCILDDNRTGEVVLLHKPSQTLIMSDLLYKSCRNVCGPGGDTHNYTAPEWWAKGQEELFYDHRTNTETGLTVEENESPKPKKRLKIEEKKPLLPAYRTHPMARTIDPVGLRLSLEKILAWKFTRAVACHTDAMDGQKARKLIREAWSFCWNC